MSDRISNQRQRPSPSIARMPRVATDSARTAMWVARLAGREQFGRAATPTMLRRSGDAPSARLLPRILQRHTRHVFRSFSGHMPLITRLYRASDDDQTGELPAIEGWPRATTIAASLPQVGATPTLARVAAAPGAMATIARTSRMTTALSSSRVALPLHDQQRPTTDHRPANELPQHQAALPMLLARSADPRAPLYAAASSSASLSMLVANRLRLPALLQRMTSEPSSAGSTSLAQPTNVSAHSTDAARRFSADTPRDGWNAYNVLSQRYTTVGGTMQRVAAESMLLARSIWPMSTNDNPALGEASSRGARLQRSEASEQQTAGSAQHAPWSLVLSEPRSAPENTQAWLSRVIARTATTGTTVNALTQTRAALPTPTPNLSAPTLLYRLAVQPARAEAPFDAPARANARAADVVPLHRQPATQTPARATSQRSSEHSGSAQQAVARSALPVRRTAPNPRPSEPFRVSTFSPEQDVSQRETLSQALPPGARSTSVRISDESRGSSPSFQRSFVPMPRLLNRISFSDAASGNELAGSSIAQRTSSVSRIHAAGTLPLVQGLAAARASEPSAGRADDNAVPGSLSAPALRTPQHPAALAQRTLLQPRSAASLAAFAPVQQNAGTPFSVLARTSLDQPDRRAAPTITLPIVARTPQATGEIAPRAINTPFGVLARTSLDQPDRRAVLTSAFSTIGNPTSLLAPVQPLVMRQQERLVAQGGSAEARAAQFAPTLLQPMRVLHKAAEDNNAGVGAANSLRAPGTGAALRSVAVLQRTAAPWGAVPGALGVPNVSQSASGQPVTGEVAPIARAALPFVQRRGDGVAPTIGAALSLPQPHSIRAPHVTGEVAPIARAALSFVQWRGDGVAPTTGVALSLPQPHSVRAPHVTGEIAPIARAALPFVQRRNTVTLPVDRLVHATASIQRQGETLGITRAAALERSLLSVRANVSAPTAASQPVAPPSRASISRYPAPHTLALLSRFTSRIVPAAPAHAPESGQVGGVARSDSLLGAAPGRFDTVRRSAVETRQDSAELGTLRQSRAPMLAHHWLPPTTNTTAHQDVFGVQVAPEQARAQRLALLRPALAWNADAPAAPVQRVEHAAPGASLALAQRTGSVPTHSVPLALPQPFVQRVMSLSTIAPARADVRRIARANDTQPAAHLATATSAQRVSTAQSYGAPTNVFNGAASQQRGALTPALSATMQRAGGQSAPSLAARKPFIARAPLLNMNMRAGSSTGNTQPEHIQPSTFGLINRLPHVSVAAHDSERLFAQPLLARRSASSAPHTAADEPRDQARAQSAVPVQRAPQPSSVALAFLPMQRAPQSSSIALAFLPVQRAPQSSSVAQVSAPVIDVSARPTGAFLPFVQQRSANPSANSVVERGFAASPSPSMVQRASARAEGAPAAFSVVPWRTSNAAVPQALSSGIVQPMWAEQRAPLLRSFSPVVQRAPEAHAPSAPPAFARHSAAMQSAAFTQAARLSIQTVQAPRPQLAQGPVQRVPDVVARMRADADVDGPQAATTLLRRAQPVPTATADVRASVGGSLAVRSTRLLLGSIQRAPDLAAATTLLRRAQPVPPATADVRTSVGGPFAVRSTRLLLGSIQRAPDLAAGVRANRAAGASQRLSGVERSARLVLPLQGASPTAWQRTPTAADEHPPRALPFTGAFLQPSTEAAPRTLDDRAASVPDTHVGAAPRAINRTPLRAPDSGLSFALLQRHQPDEHAPDQALDTSVSPLARWFHQPLVAQSPQSTPASSDNMMPSTARQSVAARHASQVSQQPYNRRAPLRFISRQPALAFMADPLLATPQSIGGWLPSLATTGAATLAQRLPATNSVSTSADQRSPVGAMMRASFAWIARRADALTAPNQPPSAPSSFGDASLPLLEQEQSSALFDGQAADRSAPTAAAPWSAAAAPMDMLRPQRAVVQRSISDEDAPPSSSYAPDVNTAASAAPDVESLARQVYARLRQRLMLDAERLGR